MNLDPVKLSQELIRCPSVTPEDAGAMSLVEKHLDELGFTCHRLPFTSKEDPSMVENLYARLGEAEPNLCFAGHTDVVPVGGEWQYDPFGAEVKDGVLYGRGASDMKCAVACWISAISEFLAENSDFKGSLSLLITGDEERYAKNGTVKVLEWMGEKGERITDCIIGEPTSEEKLGDVIKIGRRGSVKYNLTIHGTQGHVAYPHKADNPITKMVNLLHELKNHKLDDGTEFFQASNLEISSIDVGNEGANVIPANVNARFNIRFNDLHNSKSLTEWIERICKKHAEKYELETWVSAESFLTKPGKLSEVTSAAIEKTAGYKPEISTIGGTSDGRFIHKHCPLVELGMLNKTAHKIDENVTVAEIELLKNIYKAVIKGYFV